MGIRACNMVVRVIVFLAAIHATSCFLFQSVGVRRTGDAKAINLRNPIQSAPLTLRQPRLPVSRANGLSRVQCQLKFVDAVSELLKRQYKEENVKRVLESWYRMDQDYIHRERIEELDTWQEANSYIAGLGLKTFYDPLEFEWARGLRDNAKTIQDEFRRVAQEGAEELERTGNNVWVTAANATSAASYGPSWKTLALMDRCVWDPINTELFPETTRILRELNVPCLEAFFARMVPKSHINAHSDYCNFALTTHLGLDVPEGQCYIQVGNDRREWRNGELLMFDTSIYHEADNSADRMRYVLMLRVFHPDLTQTEVSAIRSIFAYLDDVELLERHVLTMAPDLVAPAKPAPAKAAATAAAAPSARPLAPVAAAPLGGTSNRAARRGSKKAQRPAAAHKEPARPW